MWPSRRRRQRLGLRLSLFDAFSQSVSGSLAYTRSANLILPQQDGSMATFNANVLPRYWNPTLSKWLYRFDPSWTQSCLRTQTLTNAAWSPNAMGTCTQDAIGPNGTTEDWSVIENGANAEHSRQQSIAFTTGVTYTLLVIAAPRTGDRFLTLLLPSAAFGSDAIATFDLSDGSSAKNATAIASGFIGSIANSHKIVYVTATATASASGNLKLALHTSKTATLATYAGNAASGVNVWGVNVTNTAYPAPFISSGASTSTPSDPSWAASLSSLGLSLTGDFSFGVEYVPDVLATTPAIRVAMHIDDGGSNNRCRINSHTAANAQRDVITTGGALAHSSNATQNDGTLIKVAMRASSAPNAAFNGVLAGASAGVTLPPGLTTVRVGSGASSNIMAGGIATAWVSPLTMTDGQLQAVTA